MGRCSSIFSVSISRPLRSPSLKRLSRVATVALATVVLAACTATEPSEPSFEIPPHSRDGLSVTLAWDVPVDLDLYFTDPSWETAYSENTEVASGSRLERDFDCRAVRAGAPPFTEIATTERPIAGRYRVGVEFSERCDAGERPANFRVRVQFGSEVLEVDGQLAREGIEPAVVEFELSLNPPSLLRLTPSKRPSLILPAPRRG